MDPSSLASLRCACCVSVGLGAAAARGPFYTSLADAQILHAWYWVLRIDPSPPALQRCVLGMGGAHRSFITSFAGVGIFIAFGSFITGVAEVRCMLSMGEVRWVCVSHGLRGFGLLLVHPNCCCGCCVHFCLSGRQPWILLQKTADWECNVESGSSFSVCCAQSVSAKTECFSPLKWVQFCQLSFFVRSAHLVSLHLHLLTACGHAFSRLQLVPRHACSFFFASNCFLPWKENNMSRVTSQHQCIRKRNHFSFRGP